MCENTVDREKYWGGRYGRALLQSNRETDSEAMFCSLLNALRARFDTLPSLPVLHAAIASLCNEVVALDSQYEGTTIFNFLLGCGPHIQFAYR